jgi:hypothetical protein
MSDKDLARAWFTRGLYYKTNASGLTFSHPVAETMYMARREVQKRAWNIVEVNKLLLGYNKDTRSLFSLLDEDCIKRVVDFVYPEPEFYATYMKLESLQSKAFQK